MHNKTSRSFLRNRFVANTSVLAITKAARSAQISRVTFRKAIAASLISGSMMLAGGAYAADWTGATDNNWSTGSNWSTGTAPNAAGLQVRFIDDDATLNGKTISVSGSSTLGQLLIGGIDNTTSRAFTIDGGTLNFDNSGSAGLISLSGNRRLTIGSSITSAGALTIQNSSAYGTALIVNSTVDAGGNALTFDVVNNASIQANGVVSNASSVTKSGVGTLTLNGANTFAGTFNFNAGTIAVGNNAAFGTSAIVLAAGGNQTFNIASGSRTLSNQITLNEQFNVNGTGNTLTFTAAQISNLTGTTTFNTGNVTTLAFGSDFALQGTGSVTKTGYGTLVLSSTGNTFSGGLHISQGTVQTGTFSDTLVLGAAGANNMLGTGAISLTDASSNLIINAASSAATVQFAGNISATNGSTIQVNNGATVDFAGGTLDFGTGASKGKLVFTGKVVLGNTLFANAAGSSMSIGGDLEFSAGSTIGQSGIDFILDSTGAQTVTASGAVQNLNAFTKQGTGTATFSSAMTSFESTSFSVLGGVMDIGTANVITPIVNMGGGTINFHTADQIVSSAKLTLLDGTNSTFNLNGFDQTYSVIDGNGALNLNLGGTSTVSNTINLGSIIGTPSAIRISDWDGSLTSSYDYIYVTSDPTASLSSFWFQGYSQGATATDLGNGTWEVRPAGFQSSEWNGMANDLLWGTGGNWVGGDEYSVPNHAGATAIFGNLAGNLSGTNISLATSDGTWTLGSLIVNSSVSTSGAAIAFGNGKIIFDSGVDGVDAYISVQTSSPWLTFNGMVQLNSRTVVSVVPNGIIFFYGGLSGSGDLVIEGPNNVRIASNLNSGYSGDIYLNSGLLGVYSDNNLGTGTLHLATAVSLGYQFPHGKMRVNNKLDIHGTYVTPNNVFFTYVGDISVDSSPTFNVTTITTTAGERAATTFAEGLNLVGSGSVKKDGYGALELMSSNNTFGGGLIVNAGTVYTTLTSDLTIGQLDAGHNYLGSGLINVNANSSASSVLVSVSSAGYTGKLSGSTLTLNNNGEFAFLDGGAFVLESGVLDGGTTSSKGRLRVAGDLTFGGTTLVNRPDIYVDTTTNTSGSSTIYGSGVISGIRDFYKMGNGTTTIDSGIVTFQPSNLYINGGTLRLSADNQISATDTNFVLNGGTFDTAGYRTDIAKLYLRADSSLLLGNTGGITAATRQTAASDWAPSAIWSIQNNGQTWVANDSTTYVRFSSDPSFSASELGNIAFTGYESGAKVVTDSGYWYLIPDATLTNEWGGLASPDNKWGTASNWLASVVPNGVNASATIRDADGSLNGKTIEVDTAYTVNRLNIETSSGANFTIGGSGTLTLDGDDAQIRHAGVNILNLATTINLNTAVELKNNVSTSVGYLDWTGTVTGSGSLTKTGSGLLQISGGASNSYTGGFLWQDASTIQINANGSLFGSGVFQIGDGTAKTYMIESTGASHTVTTGFKLAGNLVYQKDTLNGVTITDSIGTARGLTLSGAGEIDGFRTINLYGNSATNLSTQTEFVTLTLGGTLTGTGGIYKTGGGTLVLNGTGNSFSGGVELVTGMIQVSKNEALGTGVFTVSTPTSYGGGIRGVGGSITNPIVLSNQLNWKGTFSTVGHLLFDYNGTSTITGSIGFNNGAVDGFVGFGKNHILSGTGSIVRGVAGSYSSYFIMRLEGANTYSGGTYLAMGVTQVGRDSVFNENGKVISGALGTGTVYFSGGTIGAYSDTGSGITSRRLSNIISLSGSTLVVTHAGDANTLILDTPTITLRNSKLDWTVNVSQVGGILSVESQLLDNISAGYQGGITKTGAGILELKNANNQISDGIRVTTGTLLATALGDVTTGRLDTDKNYLGTGAHILDGGLMEIATVDGATVRLSGSGMTMNNGGSLSVTGGSNIRTIFDSNSSFTGTTTTGSITTSGQLIKEGAGTVTSVGARLVTPDLVLNSGTLSLTNANLMSGVTQLTMNGGTLALNGLSQTSGAQLVLSADSTIDFGAGSSILTIGSLSLSGDGLNVGSADYTLSLDNWSGNAGAGGGTDQLIISNITAGQKLYNVWFTGGYTIGAKVVLNPNNQLELVPLGKAYIWDNHSVSALWADSNWTDVGSPTAAGDGAVFADDDSGLNGRTISTGSGLTIGSVSFESTQGQQFTLSGGTITFDTADENQSAQLRLVNNSAPTIDAAINLKSNLVITAAGSEALTINGTISGANKSVSKSGDGELALNSSGSNYTSGLTINSGTVTFGASSSVDGLGGVASGPAGIGTLTINGGTLEATGSDQTLHNSVVINNDFTVAGTNGLTLEGSTGATATIANDATITVTDAAGSLTFGEDLPLTGSGDITKAGDGTLNFNSDSAGYSGDVTVNVGTVGIGADQGFGTGSVSLGNGTTLVANTDGLDVSNNIALAAGTQTIATDANDLTLSGVISGDGAVTKTGTGTLTLDAASTYTGGTTITAGTVELANADGAGTGTITVNSGTTLEASFSNGTLDNVLVGAGAFDVTGMNVRIDADNSGYTGTLTVANGASALANDAADLGSSSVVLAGTGQLTIDPVSGRFTLDNKLSGTGTLVADMATGTDVFSFGSGAANGFTGTAAINTGTVAVDANASSALTGATLQLNAGSTAQVTGSQSVGNLTMTGGTINASIDNATGNISSFISTGTLALTSGSVSLDLPSMMNSASTLLIADDGVTNQLVSAATVTGDISNITLIGADGTALGSSSVQQLTQGGSQVANASYNHSLSSTGSNGSGIYVAYELTQLELLASQTLSLTEGTGATGTSAELKAKVTGSGNLEIASNSAITISNASNDYSGSTTVSSGTAKAGVADVFKNTGDMIVASGATLDLNGFANQVNNLQGAGSVVASAALTANNTADSAFSGAISGSGSLTKIGSGELTLSGASSYTGTTTVNAGSLKLTDAGAISSGAATVATNALMELAFDSATFANVIGGAGTVKVSGTDVTLAGTNTLSGQWDVTGSAIATTEGNLGTAGVYLDGAASQLSVTPSAGFTFANALTGNGTLVATMGSGTDAFAFTSGIGSAFTGTLVMGTGSYALSGVNTTALTNATLRADSGSTVTVGTGTQSIGGLTFNGGTMVFDVTAPAQTVANGSVTAGALDINGTGSVVINVPTSGIPSNPATAGDLNILAQDDAGALVRLVTSADITGGAGALDLIDQNGTDLLTSDQQFGILNAAGTTTAATGTYGYRLNTGDSNDGLYVAYALKAVELLSGQTLTLTPSTGATGVATDLSATVSGSGNLEIAAGSATVSLTNIANSYTGTTTVTSGTLQLGSNNALGATSGLSIASGATADVNGYSQTVNGAFTGASGSTLNLAGGSLTINNGGASAGSLTGAGTLAVAGGSLDVTGANAGLTAAVSVASGAEIIIDNVAGIGTSGTATVAGELTIDAASGSFAKGVAGAGTVNVVSGSDITLTGTSTLSGSWAVDAASKLTASTQGNLGTAEIANAGQFTVNTTTDWTLANDFTGAGSFTKSGSGNLTIAQANARTGTTQIDAGVLTLTHADGVGSGNITVGAGALTLAFGTDQTFDNVLLGSGQTNVTGAGVATISSVNSAYTGNWSISGHAALDASTTDSATNLGSGAVNVTGQLTAANAGAFIFSNALTGTGTLSASNGGAAFSFASSAGSAFAGTVALSNNTFDLAGVNTAALTNATLSLGASNVTTVGSGSQAIGNLAFDGGMLKYANLTVPADSASTDLVTTGNVTVSANGGSVAVDPATAGLVVPTTPSQTNLLSQDDDAQVKLVDVSGTVTGAGGLTLTDLAGNVISLTGHTVDIIEGGSTVAIADYDYIFTGKDADGVYLGYGLKQLDLQSGQTLTLAADAGASGNAADMAAKITGSGNLAIDAINASAGTVSLSNATNDYNGVTSVQSGTLQMANDNVLGQTSDVQIAGGATLDMNGYSQTVGAVHTSVGGQLNIADGSTLTIADAQRTSGDTDGGSLEANTLFGSGTFVIDPSIVHVNGKQSNYTGNLQVTGGSELRLNTADAFDTAQSIELVTADDKLTFANLSAYNATWTDVANGSAAVSIKGVGTVTSQDGSQVQLTGDNSSFSGQFVAAVNSVLSASEQKNIGSASIQADGQFQFIADGIWQLENDVTGAGLVLKTGAGILSVDQSLSGFTGLTQVESGTLVVGESVGSSATIGGSVRIEAGALLSGTGSIAGDVYNLGNIVAFNALPNMNGYGITSTSNLTVGSLINAGNVVLGGTLVGNTLTVNGDYAGMSGRVYMNTVFGGDTSQTDRVILNGGRTTGTTSLVITNQGGAGAATNVGIQVIEATNGATTEVTAFKLDQLSSGYRSTTDTLAIGAYDYSLVKGGNGGNSESWYLTSQVDPDRSGAGSSSGTERQLRPEAGIYQLGHQVARTMFMTSLHDRDGYAGMANSNRDYAGWARVTGTRTNGRSAGNALSTTAETFTAQIGVDLFKYESPDLGTFYAGIMGGWGASDLDAKSRQVNQSKATGTTKGYSIGAYGTWYQNDRGQPGAYVDTWAQYSWFNHEVRGSGLPKEKFDAQSLTISLETGYSFLLHSSETAKIYLEPQVQLAYINYTSGSLTEASGTTIRYKDGSGLLARAGARLYGQFNLENGTVLRPYLEANYWYNQKGGKLYMNNDLVPSGAPRSFGEVKLGISGELTKNLQVWGDIGTQFGGKHYNAVTGQVGLKYTW
ncbi:autotransporter outer membrane beta-barrel domain-containing protein [Microvirga sp. W0021]|uniref:Autotransporter outer membrane beta-barrel domain-containing protein n=1 Tax=Hohaiivirga grylli TaxID=3133970 RepID=A0ABV0BM68_9HYPH